MPPTPITLVHSDDMPRPLLADALAQSDRIDVARTASLAHLSVSHFADIEVILIWLPGSVLSTAIGTESVLAKTPPQTRVVLLSTCASGLLLRRLIDDGLHGHGMTTLPVNQVIDLIDAAKDRAPALCEQSRALLQHGELQLNAYVSPRQIESMLALSACDTRKAAARRLGHASRAAIDMTAERLCRRLGWNRNDVTEQARAWLFAKGYL